MKRVDNSDVNIKLDSRIVYLSNFNAKFYTVNAESFFIRKTQDNVISVETEDNDTEYYIKLDWNELVTLGEGVLQYKIVNNVPDSDRADLYFNKNLERTTEYYINSNVTVDPESEQSYAEIIAELGVKIDSEIARSTSADTVHDEAIQDEVITRQQNVSDLTDLISANTSGITQNRSDIGDLSTALSNEITNRQNADAAISGAVDTVLASYLTISAFTEAEEIISASLNDLDDRKLDASAYTPTDLSNYYTKSEVYTKTEVDNAITTETNRATSAETTIENNLNTESRTRKWADTQIENNLAIVSGAVDTKLDASAYTPTDLSNYYTKSEVYNKTEVDNAIAAIDVSDQLSGYVQTSAFTSYSAATKHDIDSNYNHLSNLINTKADSRDVKQSDWEVIAASDNAYIKHKPFGEEPIDLDPYKRHGEDFIPNGKVNGKDSYAIHNYGINSRGLKVGDTVKINVDGDESMMLTITTLNGRLVSNNVTGNSYTDFKYYYEAALYQEGSTNASGYCETWGLVYIPRGNFDISKNHVISWYLVDSTYGQYITETKQIDNKYINYSGDTYIQSLVSRIDNKQDTLTAGTNITIVDNVISATGGGSITIDPSLDSGSSNAVANSAITNGFDTYTCKKNKDNGEVRYFYFPTPSHPWGDTTVINNFSINGRCPLTQTNYSNSYIDKFSLVETSAITTAITSSSTDAQVPSAKAVNDKLGGLSIVKLTESEYTALVTKDSNTLYCVVPDPSN